LIDCKDLLIEELIHKGGRIQQKMNESRKKVENEIIPHDLVAELILDLCRGNRLWQFLNEEKIPLQEVLEEVSKLVVRHNPMWFENHREVSKRVSECMFSMEILRG